MADAVTVQESEVIPESPPVELPPAPPKPARKKASTADMTEADFRTPGGAVLPSHDAVREDY